MEVHLSPERERQLNDLAQRQGKDPSELASEALEVFLADQEWAADAAQKIEEGWRQAIDPAVRRLTPEESRADLERRKAEYLKARPRA